MSDEQHHRLALPQGTRIRDFEFHRVLGYGGFGITYLGWNIALDIPVAIKEYLPADLATREQDLSVVPQSSQVVADFQWGLERFLDEARTLARFQHPNIVRVHHFFEAHSTAYIVMDYVEGEDLSAYLTRKGTLSEDELKGILYPLLDALEVVHQADFLHRDIKPGNIVLRDSDGSPVLLDFGAARQAIGAKSRSVTSIVTPGYAPIEQYSSRGRQGAWTDIYALGGVCYRALTGQVPDDATDRVRNDPLIPVAQRCAGQASQEFLSAIDLALSVDEGDRPQSVGVWRSALEADAGEERRGTRETLDVWRKEQVAAPSEPVVWGETGDAVPSDTKEKGEGGSKPARAKWFAVVLCVVTLLIMVAIATQEQAALERQRREQAALEKQRREQAALEKQRQEQAALEQQRQEEALYSDRKREPSAAPASGPRLATYVVKRGDYLAQIARLHQMSVAEITRINKLKTGLLRIGDRLKVRPPMRYYEEQALEQQRQEQAALEQQRQERAALGEEEEIVELWRVEKKPVITKKVKPKYPTTAQKANITGKVFVTALIGKDGKVEQIGKITGPKVFHEVAKAAALQSEFTPAMQNDRPVKVWVSLPFTFRLK